MKSTKMRALMAAAVIAVSLSASLVVATPAQAATKCVNNVYGYGGYAQCIGYLQIMLNSWAKDYGIRAIAVDNSFGAATQARVKDFQGDMWNPKLTVDGVVGPKTWKSLCDWTYYGTPAAKSARISAGC